MLIETDRVGFFFLLKELLCCRTVRMFCALYVKSVVLFLEWKVGACSGAGLVSVVNIGIYMRFVSHVGRW